MKKYLPHLIAIALFLIITLLYFAPLMSGKEIQQSDISNWKGMAKELMDFKAKTGEQTFWTNSMFGGMPTYQISAVFAANLIQYLDKIIVDTLPSPSGLVFLYLIGFYFLLITLKIDQRVAIFGALAFAFSSFFILIIEVGHNSQAHAIGYMAPVIAGIIMSYRGRIFLGAAVTGIALALELYSNHLQITYYLMMTAGILVLIELYNAIREKRIGMFGKATAMLLIAAALAVESNITSMWATQEYGKYSTRGPSDLTNDKENKTTGLDKDYITDWSYGIGETFTLLIPNFKGGASEPISKNNKDALKNVDSNFRQNIASQSAYFGDQPFVGGTSYAGAIVCMLFLLGLFIVKGPMKWWLAAASLLSVMLAWGRNFMSLTNVFIDHAPGYDKFRTVSMMLVVAEFCMPLLAAIVLDKMLKESDFFTRNKKKVNYVLIGILGVSLLILVSPGMFTSFYTQQEYDQVVQSVKGQNIPQDTIDSFFVSLSAARKSILEADALRTFFMLILGGALVWTFVRYRYDQKYFVYGMILVVMIDLVPVARRYLNNDSFSRKKPDSAAWPMTQADQYILQDTTKSFRVLNIAVNTFNDASTSYYHQSIGGYHGAKLKRYKELIDYNLIQELTTIRTAMSQQDSTFPQKLVSQPALNMLNTKYVIYNGEAAPVINHGALGNAWFANEIRYVPNADSEIAAVNQFDPKNTVIVDQKFKEVFNGFNPSSDSAASIRLTDYKPNHLTYSSSASSDQLAVFSEIYYDKGWNAYIDGKLSSYARADYVLRAMKIPAGNHVVEFKFEPQVVATGEKISLASSALLLLMAIGFGWMEFRKKPEEKS